LQRNGGFAGHLRALDRKLPQAVSEVRVSNCDAVHHDPMERRLVALGFDDLAKNAAIGRS
jgi:hypothetical protein